MNLTLPDGRFAGDLRLVELRPVLVKLGIDGMKPEMGKHDLLSVYAAHMERQAEVPTGRGAGTMKYLRHGVWE